jgi:iron complex outermembrane receptor protein
LSAQETVIEAPTLDVSSTPLASVQQVGQDVSLANSLSTVPGVVVTSQGQAAGQTDLSIRGSTFSGAGLSIAGLALRNPQTEHFHAELPFPGWWLAQPQVLTGVGQASTTEGHLTGTVNLMPLPMSTGSRLTAGADNKDGYWVNGSTQIVSENKKGSTFGAGAFAGHSEIPGVDFPGNDVQISRGGVQLQALGDNGQSDLLFGHQEKTFGARGYYGVSDTLKAEETTQDTLLIGSWRSFAPSETSFSFALREFDDAYKLWLPTSLFLNEHKSRTASAQASHRFALTKDFIILTRLAADQENIDSSALGDFTRSRLAVTVLPEYAVTDTLTLSIGVRGEVLESDEDYLLPLARLELEASKDITLFAEYSESVRRPSYTELNYESPGSLGNAGLDVQEQEAWEAGFIWQASEDTDVKASVFHHRTADTVDWIRPDAAATRWQAENIGQVDTLGAEVSIAQQLSKSLALRTRYMWMDKDADNAPYASRYTLDYATHLVSAHIDYSYNDAVRLELSQLWRDQADNVLRTEGGNEQWLTEIALHLRCPSMPNVQWSLMASNAMDDDYRVFPGQNTVTQPRVSAAVTVDW